MESLSVRMYLFGENNRKLCLNFSLTVQICYFWSDTMGPEGLFWGGSNALGLSVVCIKNVKSRCSASFTWLRKEVFLSWNYHMKAFLYFNCFYKVSMMWKEASWVCSFCSLSLSVPIPSASGSGEVPAPGLWLLILPAKMGLILSFGDCITIFLWFVFVSGNTREITELSQPAILFPAGQWI